MSIRPLQRKEVCSWGAHDVVPAAVYKDDKVVGRPSAIVSQ